MAFDALIQGRLFGDPQRRTAKNGAAFVTAKMSTTDSDGQQHVVSAIAFDQRAVEALLALTDGDSLAVAGTLAVSTYAAKDGTIKPALRLTAHQVLTPYHVKRRREAMAGRSGEGTQTVRTPADRQRRHAAAMRFQQPLPDDDDIAAMPDDPV